MKFLLTRLLRDGRTTVPYPQVGMPAPTGARGKPVLDAATCAGCPDCAQACPTNALQVLDRDGGHLWRLDLATCVFCGRCADACTNGAVTLSPQYELAATSRAALVEEIAIRGDSRVR